MAREQLGEIYNSPLSFEEFKKGVYWRDHIVEFPGRFKEVEDSKDPTLIYHEPNEGTIIQKGTPVSATNLNFRDHAIWTLYQLILPLKTKIENLEVEISTMTGAAGTNSFIVDIQDFEVIEGYVDPITGNVMM